MKIPKQELATNPQNTYLITSALPYANGDIHLGHLVEVIQTDIFVRFKKLNGCRTIYVCADDTHGTPIQLNAQKRGISCEDLIAEAWENHVQDYAKFSIGFDIFYSTNSPENQKWSEYIFAQLKKNDFITEREIEQYFCPNCQRFLPDRFIKGTCPKCGKEDQYGDVCEACGATYDPTDLHNPVCGSCQEKPQLKKTKHFFVKLTKAEPFLREFLSQDNVLQEDMNNFVMHWVNEGLKEWCISRDGPYFGFKIPETENKYFYVWLDAPVGYIAATDKWCQDHNQDINQIWQDQANAEVIHFIGKDIVYFHTLFWPVMLHASSLNIPSKVFVHGFLTVQGEKMSKTRGTFILAREYNEKVKHPAANEYLRFYFGSKLTNNSSDLDLNFSEFCNKVNTILANNIGNLHHRTFVFLDRYFNSQVPDAPWDNDLAQIVEEKARDIAQWFEQVDYKSIIETIQFLGSLGNKYYQDQKPWELIKNNPDQAAQVMVTCVNLIKACAVFLKPFIPGLIAKLENQYNHVFQWQDCYFSIKNYPMEKTEKIVIPIELKEFDQLLGRSSPTKDEKKKQAKDETSITANDFQKIKMLVGTIEEAEKIEKSNKLVKLKVHDGSKQRQIIAGIGKDYTPEEIIGKQIVFLANLKPAKIMGLQSEGMVLAAIKGKKLSLIQPDKVINAGAAVS